MYVCDWMLIYMIIYLLRIKTYIYIYIEREREGEMHACISLYTYIQKV